MDWLNLHTSVLDSPEVVGAEPVDRGTWLMLQRYCIGQENGGRIAGCRGWKDRKWQQLARVTLAEVNRETELWAWDLGDLVVWGYPVEKENIVRVKREIARENGTNGGRPKKPKEKPILEPILVISGKAEVEVEGKGKSKEKGTEAAAALAERLCLAHPSKALTRPALTSALAALQKHPFEKVLAGTVAYAEAVAEWTPAERIRFVKNPEAFFAEDIWNQPAANWKSRTEAQRVNGHQGREIDVGGRAPAGVMTAHLGKE